MYRSTFAISVPEILKCLANNICDLPSLKKGTVERWWLSAPFYSVGQKKSYDPDTVSLKNCSTINNLSGINAFGIMLQSL